ncbi:hypothetical protein VII00023_03533 [Vibrio ichthyoenteri ATCC 700023]|uniref:Uncharacterized protein n=1 Tax=Vibrio ichthyoenteri ATCC 700023 TaxID=870968 RepID=F9S205_9VIBR|nr:hypothetical protein VII00023_03533 [Vibrio ichthyoenteri ATCC 700023]
MVGLSQIDRLGRYALEALALGGHSTVQGGCHGFN